MGGHVVQLVFGSGIVCWIHSGIASGLYLVRVRVNYEDGTMADKILKVIILRQVLREEVRLYVLQKVQGQDEGDASFGP